MQFPQSLPPERRQNSRISTIEVHHLKCLEGNCMRNFSPADERRPQGLPTRIRTLTVRACSGCSAALPRKSSPSTGLSAAIPRKNSPSIGLSVALPRKSSPGTPENSIFRPFWACRANFFAHTPIPGRAGRTFSRIARDDGATLKPATPLHATPRAPLKPPTPLHATPRAPLKPPTPLQATLRAPLKPTTPLQGRNGTKMAFHRSQRRWRFHSAARKC